MNRKLLLVGAVALVIVLAAGAAFSAGLVDALAANRQGPSVGMPVPGATDVEDMIVGSEMPVPGLEGVEDMIVGSEMPVPGLEGIEEMIVGSEMPVPGLEGVAETVVSEE